MTQPKRTPPHIRTLSEQIPESRGGAVLATTKNPRFTYRLPPNAHQKTRYCYFYLDPSDPPVYRVSLPPAARLYRRLRRGGYLRPLPADSFRELSGYKQE